MSPGQAAPAVRFGATPYAIDGSTVLRLPDKAGNRPGPFEEREADRSAMIHLAYAVSEPCDPWEMSQG